jgi:hypothetical protein
VGTPPSLSPSSGPKFFRNFNFKYAIFSDENLLGRKKEKSLSLYKYISLFVGKLAIRLARELKFPHLFRYYFLVKVKSIDKKNLIEQQGRAKRGRSCSLYIIRYQKYRVEK